MKPNIQMRIYKQNMYNLMRLKEKQKNVNAL